MITRLEEKGRKKADRYWPTKRRKEMVLAGGQTRVTFLSEQLCQDAEDLYKRSFRVSRDGKPGKNVVYQLHCDAWSDMETQKGKLSEGNKKFPIVSLE